jgi:hypothetical protein
METQLVLESERHIAILAKNHGMETHNWFLEVKGILPF